jgi:hypothetical protein
MSISAHFKQLAAIVGLGALCATAYADTATFSRHEARDPNGANHLAISYLIPKGWKATDTVQWNLQQRNAPLMISTVTTSPDDRFVVRWINRVAFSYGHQGNKGTIGKDPPEHPTDLLIEVFKSGHPGVEVEVVDRQETPANSIFKANESNPVPQTWKSRALTCSVKLRYVVNGVPMLTKSGFNFDGYDMGRDPRFSNGMWSLFNITSITGPEAEFPKAMRLAAVVLSSRQWDPQFFQQYQEVVIMILKQTQREGQEYLDAQFAAMRQHFHDLSSSNMEAFKAEMAAKDKNTRNFCDYVLDRERYTDGHTEFIMPSGYNRAATNGSDYLLTNDPSYSPSGDWHELKKVN